MSAGSWTTSDADQTLTAGNLYFNVHTTAEPAGEIRGQVLAQ